MKASAFFGTLAFLAATSANGALVTFTDTQLASGNPVTSGGVTLTTSTVGGIITFIPGSGGFAGLWLDPGSATGSFTLTFSQSISSIEIEFDALSSIGPGAPETLFGFATNNGPVSISYSDQVGTTFDGTTITSTVNDAQGIISFTGPDFTSFSFMHNQGDQEGFVIENIVIDTDLNGGGGGGGGEVPEPALLGLLGAALLAMRRMHNQAS